MTQCRWRRCRSVALALALSACLGSCEGCEEEAEDIPSGERPLASEEEQVAEAPEPIEPLPESVEVDMRKVLLGRRLYFDTALSGDGTLSCASCHSLDHGGAEDRPTSIGIRGQVGPINAPTVLNSGLNFVQFWDGRAADLAEQAAGPVANPAEMGATWEDVVARLGEDASYAESFGEIYEDGVTQTNVTDAIAEYERSLLTPSPFDAFLRGDESAIGEEARRGYETFKTVGCTACHLGVNIGGGMYQKMGLVRDYFADRGGELTDADMGRFNVTQQEADRHFFKVPTLRNVEHTAPYLHDGSQATLEDVVRVMGRYQLGRDLDDAQVGQLVAFLRSLSGELPEHARPPETGEGEGEEPERAEEDEE